MSFQHLLEEVTALSSLLKVDFIYKPGNVQQNTERTVFWLEQNQVLARDEEGYIGLSDLERACGRENYGKWTEMRGLRKEIAGLV